MSITDGILTSQTDNVSMVIPNVDRGALARAVYLQYQATFDIADSVKAQSALLDNMNSRLSQLTLIHDRIPPGPFQPSSPDDALQTYLDLLGAGVPGDGFGPKDAAVFYLGSAARFTGFPLKEVDAASRAAALSMVEEGQLTRIRVNGIEDGWAYKEANAAAAMVSPGMYPGTKAPDGKDWGEMTGTTIPVDALPRSFYQSTDPLTQQTRYYMVTMLNGLVEMPAPGSEVCLAFPGSATADQVSQWRDLLSRISNSVGEQSRTSAAYILHLVGELNMLVTLTSNSVTRAKRVASTINAGISG